MPSFLTLARVLGIFDELETCFQYLIGCTYEEQVSVYCQEQRQWLEAIIFFSPHQNNNKRTTNTSPLGKEKVASQDTKLHEG